MAPAPLGVDPLSSMENAEASSVPGFADFLTTPEHIALHRSKQEPDAFQGIISTDFQDLLFKRSLDISHKISSVQNTM